MALADDNIYIYIHTCIYTYTWHEKGTKMEPKSMQNRADAAEAFGECPGTPKTSPHEIERVVSGSIWGAVLCTNPKTPEKHINKSMSNSCEIVSQKGSQNEAENGNRNRNCFNLFLRKGSFRQLSVRRMQVCPIWRQVLGRIDYDRVRRRFGSRSRLKVFG